MTDYKKLRELAEKNAFYGTTVHKPNGEKYILEANETIIALLDRLEKL